MADGPVMGHRLRPLVRLWITANQCFPGPPSSALDMDFATFRPNMVIHLPICFTVQIICSPASFLAVRSPFQCMISPHSIG
jgi:hypothetical protein